jgi:hypothetical protein
MFIYAKKMTGIAISHCAFDKYFRFLRKLDNNSKRRLIIKLTESIEKKEDSSFDITSIYGTWDDSRDSEEIINSIRNSRVNSRETELFE